MDASDATDATVRDNTDASRYEIVVDGAVAGYAEYERREGAIELTHTVVDDAYEGQGVGSRLAAGALDAARADGLEVVPTCSFIASYIDSHDEYADLRA